MTVDNWIQLLVPVIGIIVAALSAALTYLFAKKKQRLADESRLKEKYYIAYIEAISNIVVTNRYEKSRNQLADAQNHLLLVGSADVVAKLMVFHDFIKPSNQSSFTSNGHDELLTDLIKSMRSDLYKKKTINDGFPTIHLTGQQSRQSQ